MQEMTIAFPLCTVAVSGLSTKKCTKMHKIMLLHMWFVSCMLSLYPRSYTSNLSGLLDIELLLLYPKRKKVQILCRSIITRCIAVVVI